MSLIRVDVKKDGVLVSQSSFDLEAEADAWLSAHIKNLVWGKPERWIKQSEIPLLGEDISKSTAFEERETDLGTALFFKFPADCTFEKVDITEEHNLQKEIEESEAAFALALKLKAKIRAINVKRLKTGSWNAGKWNQFKTDPTISNVFKAIDTASLNDAKALIQALNEDFYSASDKSGIIAMIDAHNSKWGAI